MTNTTPKALRDFRDMANMSIQQGQLLTSAAHEIDRLRDERTAMMEALEECAADLEAEIKANYPARIQVPSQEQRYQNDMAPVIRARAIIARAKGETA